MPNSPPRGSDLLPGSYVASPARGLTRRSSLGRGKPIPGELEQRPLVSAIFPPPELAVPRLELLRAVGDPAALDDVDVEEVEELEEVELVEAEADADPDEVH